MSDISKFRKSLKSAAVEVEAWPRWKQEANQHIQKYYQHENRANKMEDLKEELKKPQLISGTLARKV